MILFYLVNSVCRLEMEVIAEIDIEIRFLRYLNYEKWWCLSIGYPALIWEILPPYGQYLDCEDPDDVPF